MELYRRRLLPSEDTLSANDHLFSCTACFQRFQAASEYSPHEPVWIDFAGQSPVHDLIYEQIEGYVDDELSEAQRSLFERHLETCELCKREVADLLLHKALMSHGRESALVLEARSVAKKRTETSRFGLGAHVGAPVAAASIAAVVLVAVGLPWIAVARLRGQITLLRGQVTSLEGTNEGLLQQVKTQRDAAADLRRRVQDLEAASPAGLGAVSTPESGRPLLTVSDGGRLIQVAGGSVIGLGSAVPYFTRPVMAALKSSKVYVPSLQGLREKPMVIMGPSEPPLFSLTDPVGVVVEDDRPVFSWSPVPGATAYRVTIVGDRSERMLLSPELSGNRWQVSSPLARGEIYSWKVRAVFKEGREISAPVPPSLAARFKVLDDLEERRLTEARRLVPVSHLVLGVLYAKAGMIGNAQQEFQALAEANPNSPLVRRLLKSIDGAATIH
jgi:hypothetical protein